MNHAVFDGQLVQPQGFMIKERMKDCWGWCDSKRTYSKKSPIVIGISEEVDDRAFFLAILAHEMVHQYEQQSHGRMSHGKNFWMWKSKIENLGLEFSDRY